MRILHTADWHLGIKLHKKDLSEDHKIFFEWLVTMIKEREIEALLISGDIFDQANPSPEARQLYYSFLKQLIHLKCKVIITGGNHDSPAVLNGPKDILAMLNVNIIGNVPIVIDEGIIELKNKQGQIECLVCAVPYLRDADIRTATENETYKNRIEQRYTGMKRHFQTMVDYCQKKYGEKTPIILMGHLFTSGVATSDSERDITMGSLNMFSSNDFPDTCKYIALGHIHRPQRVGNSETIRYSGSPIPLSFSEKTDKKIVLELEVYNNCIQNVIPHETPAVRTLKRFSGTLKEVQASINLFRNDKTLKSFAELDITEKNNDPSLHSNIHKFITEFKSDHLDILTYKFKVVNKVLGIEDLYEENKNIEDITPREVLLKRLEMEDVSEVQKKLITEAFDELLQQVNEEV